MHDFGLTPTTAGDSLVLAKSLSYRREHFGATVYDSDEKSVRFFNVTAAHCLEAFMLPRSAQHVSNIFDRTFHNADDMRDFIESLTRQGLLRFDSIPHPVKQEFYTDRIDFNPDRLVAPLALEFELTLKCRRKCDYCAYTSHPQFPTTGEVNLEGYRNAFSQAKKAGVFYLRFTGGDPLFRSDALEIIEAADSAGFAVAVASDLTVLTDLQVARLATLKNLTLVQTTLDGPNASVADRHRGSGNFTAVTHGIARLREVGIPVMVGTVLTKDNVNEIYSIAQLLAAYDVTYCVSPLYSAGRGRELEELIPDDGDLSNAFEQFARAVETGLVRAADPGWDSIAQRYQRDNRAALWASQPWLLRSPDRILRIDPFGNCYAGIQAKEVLHEDVYAGKLTDHPLLDIWEGAEALNTLRKEAKPNTYYGSVVDIRSLRRNAYV